MKARDDADHEVEKMKMRLELKSDLDVIAAHFKNDGDETQMKENIRLANDKATAMSELLDLKRVSKLREARSEDALTDYAQLWRQSQERDKEYKIRIDGLKAWNEPLALTLTLTLVR